ncbi:uncharacterized protein LOC131214510 [Anopheles bellator]|nr:uncharacterized protein LOC131214509 [Anopheles bellator]XP_058064861.1 uncharacterized protein LOC131214510 [Anopheles bellator]
MACTAQGNQTALIVATEQADFEKKADSQANRKRKANNGSDESESRTKVAKAGKNMVARSGSNTLLRAADANVSPISNRESNQKLKNDPKSADNLKPPGKSATPDPRNIECSSVPMKNATSKTDFRKKMRIAPNIPKDTVSKGMDINRSPCSSVSGGLADKNCREKESLMPNKHRVNSKVLQTKGKEDQSQNPLHTTVPTTRTPVPRVSIPLKRLSNVSKEQIAASNVGASHKNEQQSITGLKPVAIAQSMSSAQTENLDSNVNTLVDADTANQKPLSLNGKSTDEASSIAVEKPPADDQQPSVDQGKTTCESIAMQSLDITRAQNEADLLGNPSSFSSVDKSSDPTVTESSSPATKSPKVGIKHRRHSTYGSIRVCRDLFDAPQESVEFAAIRNNLMIRKPPSGESFTLLNGAASNPDPSTIGQHHDDTVVSVSPMQFSVANPSVVRPPPPRRKSVCFGINNQPTLMPKNVSLNSDPARLSTVQRLVDNAASYSVRPLQQVSVTRALPSGMTSTPSRVIPRVAESGPVLQSAQQARTTAGSLRTYRQPSTLRAEPSVTAGNATTSQMAVNAQPNLVRPPQNQVSTAGPLASGTQESIQTFTIRRVIFSQAVGRNIRGSHQNAMTTELVNTTTNSVRPASNQ